MTLGGPIAPITHGGYGPPKNRGDSDVPQKQGDRPEMNYTILKGMHAKQTCLPYHPRSYTVISFQTFQIDFRKQNQECPV